jgi:hypothetical protein
MRKRIGLIIAVLAVIVMAAILYSGHVFDPKDPLPTFESLPSFTADDTQLTAPTETTEASGYIEEFYAGAKMSELAPKLPDMLLPDFTDMEETYPISFGKDNVGGRRVIAYNGDEYAEAYMTYINGGVWTVQMRCIYSGKDTAVQEFRNFLSDWVIPPDPENQNE